MFLNLYNTTDLFGHWIVRRWYLDTELKTNGGERIRGLDSLVNRLSVEITQVSRVFKLCIDFGLVVRKDILGAKKTMLTEISCRGCR